MGFYGRKILPRAIDLVCGQKAVQLQRAQIIPSAAARVLEIGVGTGLNFPFYDPKTVTEIVGLDPSGEMLDMAAGRAAALIIPSTFIGAEAEAVPLKSASVDTVVLTYSLCSVARPAAAVSEMRRVLRPGGRLLFAEHGLAPDVAVRSWQNALTPVWKRIAGGCHLNRDIPALIQEGGFRIEEIDSGYLPGPKPMTFNYLGSAQRRN